MKKLILALALVSGAAFAEETERPVLVISTAAGVSTAGGEIGIYNDAGRLGYGVAALVTGGSSVWAGALLDARWTLLPEARFSPYLGLGLGVQQNQWNARVNVHSQDVGNFGSAMMITGGIGYQFAGL